jgi:F0F1-type ATP synthase membrane subunit c/vacuolar-type H+-ATPase subunit K
MADQTNGTDTSPPRAAPTASHSESSDTLDLKARLDRFGELLGKGLDLAEAGLSLGLTVVGTLGAVAQQKIFEKVMEGAASEPSAPQSTAPPPASPETAPAPPTFGITNRLRLAPGLPVSISFSINNDSATAPKQVVLRLEPFTGERTGALLPPASLAVTPDTAAIAPMDFEKFVLRGTIPESTPPDLYHGSIAVDAETVMRIPVLLVIES